MKLNTAIVEIRTAKGVTQEEVHQETGLSLNFISRVENGSRNYSPGSLIKVAEVCSVPEWYFSILALPDSKTGVDHEIQKLKSAVRKLIEE